MSFFTVTRTIHPIGHGAFYTEQIEYNGSKCHIVYDCGSKRKEMLKDEIDRTFRVGEEILAVFISHLDTDHVNGLEHLLNRCKVKYVFLPVLTDDEKWALVLEDENKNIWDLIMNPRETISGFSAYDPPVIIEVSHVEDEDSWLYDNDNVFILNTERVTIDDIFRDNKPIRSGTCIQISGVSDWVYIPYNIRQKKFQSDIIKQLQWMGLYDYSPEMYPTLSPDEQKQVQTALSNVIKNKNKNSMTLYSGSLKWQQGKHIFDVIYRNTGTITRVELNGCLYLGDFELTPRSTRSLFKYYQEYSKNVFAVQVPHHGSLKNFHENILGFFPYSRIYFISAPENDKGKHHPSGELLRLLLRNNRFVKHVSEAEESRFQMRYEI